MEQTPNVETVRKLVAQYSNWGRWGDEDQVGTLNHVTQDDIDLYDLRYVDAVTGETSGKISDGVPSSGFIITSKKKLVYSKLAQTGSGLFVADLP